MAGSTAVGHRGRRRRRGGSGASVTTEPSTNQDPAPGRSMLAFLPYHPKPARTAAARSTRALSSATTRARQPSSVRCSATHPRAARKDGSGPPRRTSPPALPEANGSLRERRGRNAGAGGRDGLAAAPARGADRTTFVTESSNHDRRRARKCRRWRRRPLRIAVRELHPGRPADRRPVMQDLASVVKGISTANRQRVESRSETDTTHLAGELAPVVTERLRKRRRRG